MKKATVQSIVQKAFQVAPKPISLVQAKIEAIKPAQKTPEKILKPPTVQSVVQT